jgi:hypothetical protein
VAGASINPMTSSRSIHEHAVPDDRCGATIRLAVGVRPLDHAEASTWHHYEYLGVTSSGH